ncbi:MAG: pyridoxal phosphate-dependent aminotransferase [Bacteroidales bacterium]|nr:pyridoxal phosphate-dependent aminotransferase [Bacteroidales bacterium]
MIQVKKSGAKYSAIVAISEDLKKRHAAGEDILFLNRGINSVVNINLSQIISQIDFNSPQIQVYPPNKGHLFLRKAINQTFFHDKADTDNIFITVGGMGALDLIFKSLQTRKVWLHENYWGAYVNALKINQINYDFYSGFDEVLNNQEQFKGSALIICDPNNPTGNKLDDEYLLQVIEKLNDAGIVIIWDSPYRKLFFEWDEDDFYTKLLRFENLIISESFSKSVGLSGQRIGFVHSTNKAFNQELNIKLLYATNGINGFAQVLVSKLLSTGAGKQAVSEFKRKTTKDISKNIAYLANKGFLAEQFYQSGKPVGIFVVANKSYEELLAKGIGSVPFAYFTTMPKEQADSYTRICVSVPHDELVRFFERF